MAIDTKKLKASIEQFTDRPPSDEEMLKLLKDAGAPDVPADVLAAATPEAIHAFGFHRLMEEAQELARAVYNAVRRCRVCEPGKPICAHCVTDMLPIRQFAGTMACISQLVAARAVADKQGGSDNGPFEVH